MNIVITDSDMTDALHVLKAVTHQKNQLQDIVDPLQAEVLELRRENMRLRRQNKLLRAVRKKCDCAEKGDCGCYLCYTGPVTQIA